jgi:hypothetical protein
MLWHEFGITCHMKIIQLPIKNKLYTIKAMIVAQLELNKAVIKAGNQQFVRNNPFMQVMQTGLIA